MNRMQFRELSNYLLKLEQTPKRLEITAILADLIRQLSQSETREATYLIMGILKAPFEDLKFNLAEKMVLKIIENTYATVKNPITTAQINEIYRRTGDLGDTVFELAPKNKESTIAITDVYKKLTEIATTSGTGSQDIKIKKTAALLKELDNASAKFVVRIILGNTRLGFTELTHISALAAYLGDKKLAKQIEAVYSIHPDIGVIAEKIKKHGIKGINEIMIEPGVPILSQKAQRYGTLEETIEKMQLVWAEFKFDGTRVQLHMDRKSSSTNYESVQTPMFSRYDNTFLIETFTRNLERTTHQYPDIVHAAKKQINADAVILDGEAIGYDKKTGDFLPFQETIQRKRKHDVKDAAKNIPLKYFVFDILYLNGKSLINESLRERKRLLKEIIKPGDVITVDEYFETDNTDKLHDYYEIAKKKGLEGLIVKKPEDKYQAGARSYSWVKLKRADEKLLEDSIDCVVLGYYDGKGMRSEFGIGGFLAGVYDSKEDKFKTITKVGTGLTEEDFDKLKKLCDKVKTNKLPSNVAMDKIYLPDVITLPKIVVELGADEISESPSHSAGYALRFPRLLKFREDKSPTEATTVEEIKAMHKHQKRGKY